MLKTKQSGGNYKYRIRPGTRLQEYLEHWILCYSDKSNQCFIADKSPYNYRNQLKALHK